MFLAPILALLLLLCLAISLYSPELARLVKWLKGSRRTYYLFGEKTESTIYPLEIFRIPDSRIRRNTIEIGSGLLNIQSVICGPASDFWRIAGSWHRERTGDWVRLEQVLQGLPIETALRLINTYPSLQAMLDRIAELEKESLDDKAKIQELSAAICALFEQILSDKQRYRGAVALELRHDLETIINEAKVSASNKWTFFETWKSRFEKNRDLRDKISRG